MKQYEVHVEFNDKVQEKEIESIICKELDVSELYIQNRMARFVIEAEEYYDVEIAMHYVVFSPEVIGDYVYYELID